MRNVFLILAILISTFLLALTPAQTQSSLFSPKVDSLVYPENPKSITLPAAGGKYIDDLAGAEVLRLTDEHDGNGGNFSTTYSVWDAFNCDDTRIWLFELGGSYYVANLDPIFGSRVGPLQAVAPAPAKIYADYETAFWSFKDQDKIFILLDAKLYFYRPSTKTYSLIKDLTSLFPAGTFFKQLYVSKDDNRLAALALNNTLGDQGFLVYDIAADSVKLNVKVDQINGITMGKEGKYVFLVRYVDDPVKQYVYNIDTGAVDTLSSDPITGLPDYTIGHNDTGDDFIVGGDQWRGSITARKLSAPHDVTMAWQYTKVTGWISWHVSMRADNEAWALVSTFGGMTVPDGNGGTMTVQDGPFVREIFQVGVKPPFLGQVRRLVHDRSSWVAPYYWYSTRAAISRDGRLVAYTSDNNGVPGVDRTDLFIAKIEPAPSALVSLPTPSPTPISTPVPSPSPTPLGTPQPATDSQPPTVTITSPAAGATVSGTITISATASDNVAVDSTYLIVDGLVAGFDGTSPYSFSLDTTKLADGSHVLYVRAWDAAANAGDSARVTFTVTNNVLPSPTPTPLPSPSPSATPTPVPSPSPTPTPLPSPSPSPCKKLPNGKCRKS